MKNLLLLLSLIFLFSCENTDTPNINNKEVSSKNIQLAQEWIDNLLLNNLDAVENSMHEEFTFVYMGITENENGVYGKGGISYGKNEFLLDYWPVVGELLPNGIILKTLDIIADSEGVALIQEGDAEGINGEYDNKYVWIFKFKDNLIYKVREYNSDLLVGTKLYKNKLVSIDPSNIADPKEFVEEFLIYFNAQDKSNIEKITSSPFYFNDQKYNKYTDAFNFDGLKSNGWSYSSVIDTKTLFNNGHAALISFDFARHNKDGIPYLKSRIFYMLTVEEGKWILNGGYTPSPIPMGN